MDGKGSKLGTDTSAAFCFLPGQGQIVTWLMLLGSVKAQNYLQTLANKSDIWPIIAIFLTKS